MSEALVVAARQLVGSGELARLVGGGLQTFHLDKMRRLGLGPQPIRVGPRWYWDRAQLDAIRQAARGAGFIGEPTGA